MFETLMKMCFTAVVQNIFHNKLMFMILIEIKNVLKNGMDFRGKIKYEDVYID